MAASEYAMGEDHPATYTEQPLPTRRRMELSGEAFGEVQTGIMVPVGGQPRIASEDCPHSD